jgi:hydroxycarboxylate dehydrogenase B
MKQVQASELREIGTRIFDALGCPHQESEWVSESLVNSNLRGYDSHGVIRVAQYVQNLRAGQVKPGAPFQIVKETTAMAVVDGQWGWGQVVARKAMELAIRKARSNGVGTVAVRNSQHVARLGEYPALAVSYRMVGMAVINNGGTQAAEKVAPWGGIDPKLAANPIAWAAPSGHEWPIVVDMTTSVIPEGKVRLANYKGQKLPEGCFVDADGDPSTDPKAFYGPPQGALLPLGGGAGHKGYGLNLMTELLGGCLSGTGCVGERQEQGSSGLFFQAFNIENFVPYDRFVDRVVKLESWIKSSRRARGVDEILIPGEAAHRELGRRLRDGIPLDDAVWEEIRRIARELGIDERAESLYPARRWTV